MGSRISKMMITIIILIPITVSAQKGCCSHHGGVSGCSYSGRIICNDGTYSKSCTCPKTYIYGCTDSNAINYNSSANTDDGSCIKKVMGCMNSSAINYNSAANVEDGSCRYKTTKQEQEEIPYETKIEKGDQEYIKQVGENGIKEKTIEIITNADGNVISSNVIDEQIIKEAQDEIKVEKDKTNSDKEPEKDEDSNKGSSIFVFGAITYAIIAYLIYQKLKY